MDRKHFFSLTQLMRWYGPSDIVPLQHIAQAGCSGVVSALHDVPVGEAWSEMAISTHKKLIESQNLTWTVVESLPVHEAIKTRSDNYHHYIENYKKSLINLAKYGIKVVTYNFMPILDWLRTDVAYHLPNGVEALNFDKVHYVIFDLFILKRANAKKNYSREELEKLANEFEGMNETERAKLQKNMLLGLPGSDVPFTIEQVRDMLKNYAAITPQQLKANLIYFLKTITPIAEKVGIQLAIHPDDPPFSVLGLPRIMSTSKDIEDILTAVPSVANGLCFCTGSYGVRADNDLLSMIKKWGTRIYFLHLRNTKRDGNGSFFEANHLEGDADMYALMLEIIQLMQRENRSIPMRPDHGHKMLDDIDKITYPGYSAIGRLKGLAELRGLEYGIAQSLRC